MIPAFALSFVEGILGPKFAHLAKPAIYALLIVLVIVGLGIAKCSYDHHVIAQHDAQQEVKVQQKLQPANDHASAQRSTDVIAINQSETEAHNAIHSVPDAAPAAPSVRLGCDRLRRAGKDLTRIPACAGLASGH